MEPELIESQISGEFVPLTESSVAETGKRSRIRLIRPGKGSSGFYPTETLRRDGPVVFMAGTKMYADHPTEAEAKARPERSIKDIVATLATDAVYEESGPEGPGLYAEMTVTPDWAPRIATLAPHIGLSIRTAGMARIGEVDGYKGKIIESLVRTPFTSVDFVTEAGAGGKILELFESIKAETAPAQAPVEPVVTESQTAGEKPADSKDGEGKKMETENLQESAVRIAKLCNIAGKSTLIAQFLEEKKSPLEVAEFLLEAKAKDDEKDQTSSTNAEAAKPTPTADPKALVKLAEARAEAYRNKGGK